MFSYADDDENGDEEQEAWVRPEWMAPDDELGVPVASVGAVIAPR